MKSDMPEANVESSLLRPPAVAGAWYSAEPDQLATAVDQYLAAVSRRSSAGLTPRALVAPHAGLVYSGQIAAHAYDTVRDVPYDVVVLAGPSHYVAFDGVSIWPRGAFETPFGPVAIDPVAADRVAAASPLIRAIPEAHVREHALELQLPFLRRLMPETPIVPLVIGRQVRETIIELADALVAALADRRVLLVASTDLSHYFPRERAQSLDQRVIEHIERFDAEALLTEMERYPAGEFGRYVACGGGATVAVMRAARGLGARRACVLRHGDSSEVSGDTTRVVGYLAAVME